MMSSAERLAALVDGADPTLVLRVKSGFAVMSSTQFLPGYCLLLAFPEVKTLNDLSTESRIQFLSDMAMLGDAVTRATNCARVNYGIYGNLDRFLHAHVVPRFDHEDVPYCILPPMNYPAEIREADEHQYNADSHFQLLESIRNHLKDLITHHAHHNPIAPAPSHGHGFHVDL